MKVRTRIAPSPTGYAHLGLIARILINYALARKNNGEFIWRNEDTDSKRIVHDSLEFNMKWAREFGYDWDEGPDIGGPYAPYNQSERKDKYIEASEVLIKKGYAYKCFCTEERLKELREFQASVGERTKYDGKCRNLTDDELEEKIKNGEKYTVRIKIPENKIIKFDDAITQTHIEWNSSDIDDYVILKSDGMATYHLASTCDDIAMKITHVFRGAEWISTTPVHLLIYEGLGVQENERPQIGHFTVILDPDTPGKKFSKRNSNFKVNGLLIKGYLKEAVLNYLMLLGWAPKDNSELFTLKEFIEVFDLNGMQKSNPTWDYKKMDWFNGIYIRKLSLESLFFEFINWIKKFIISANENDLIEVYSKEGLDENEIKEIVNFASVITEEDKTKVEKMLALLQERAVNFFEILKQLKIFYSAPGKIKWDIDQTKGFDDKLSLILSKVVEIFSKYEDDVIKWKQEEWVEEMRKINKELGLKGGDSFMALRIALTGSPYSPPLFEAIQILGKNETLSRLGNAISNLSGK